jgi:hypothetical protein
MRTNWTCTLLSMVALALSLGCQEPAAPPLFNAIDRSLTCEPGKIGWDFSTGGFEDEVRNASLSNELRIIEATYGGACNGVTAGNWTQVFASSCNGNVSCSRTVREAGDQDPAGGCSKDFKVKYACGVEERTYEVTISAEAGDKRVDLRCGEIINISRATYGKNCKPELDGNLTGRIAGRCSGARRCTLASGNAAFGGDPAPGCAKQAEFRYYCGNSRDEMVATYEEGAPIDFQCPVRPLVETSDRMTILSATYGRNCSAAQPGNATASVERVCNGRASCNFRVNALGLGDPASGCAKQFYVRYTCTGSNTPEEVDVPAEAANTEVSLKCAEPIAIVTASYGANAGAPANNLFQGAQSYCNTRGVCAYGLRGNLLYAFISSDPNDPAPGRAKRFSFQYRCGPDSAILSREFGENDWVAFDCPVRTQRAGYASGLRIVSATQGANCPNVDVATLRNNALSRVTTSCFGRDVCDYQHNGIGFDPVPGCRKDLDITYRCGEEQQQYTARLEAESGTLRLSCEPAIRVIGATFGSGCGGVSNNVMQRVQASCDGKRGTCAMPIGGTLGDLFPNCGKDFAASYTCGADPAVKRITLPAEASFQTANFSCPTPATPYVRKACIPLQCSGRQRRDADLNCVSDLTKPVVSSITSSSVTFTDPVGARPTRLRQNTAYSVDVAMTFSQGFRQLPPDQVLTNATIWAFDTFVPKAGGTRAEGFRCILANVGLRTPTDGSATLRGRVTRAVISPACFGQNVTSWRDAAKRININEVEFRRRYDLAGNSGTLRLSFDPEGRTVALRSPGVTEQSALVPNPIGFFYDAPSLWVDSKSYYEQTQVSYDFREQGFDESTRIDLVANLAEVRNPGLNLSLTDDFILPTLEVDFTWALQGDAPGRNPFSMDGAQLDSSIATLAGRNLGATIEITPSSRFAQRGSASWVSPANSMVIGRVQGTKLSSGAATGNTVRLFGEFSPALRERMLRIDNGSNGGWMRTATDAQTDFRVRVCLDMDGMTRSGGSEETQPLSASRGGVTYTAGFATGRRCIVAMQNVRLQRDLTYKVLRSTGPTSGAEAGRNVSQGDSSVSTDNDFGSQNSCQRQCTFDADCGGMGRVCRRRGGSASEGLGVCTGDAAANSACSALQRQAMGTGGSAGRSQFSITSATASGRNTATNRATASSDVNAEALSFKILDSTGEGKRTMEDPVSFGWNTIRISLIPNFTNVQRALNAQQAVQASLYYKLEAQRPPPSRGVEREGLSIGLTYQKFLFFGPLPVVAELSATTGIGLGLQLEVELNKGEQGQPGSPLYPCFGSSRCVQVSSQPRNFIDASKDCADRGGRLVESGADGGVPFSTVLSAINSDSTPPGTNYWIGAQPAYRYNNEQCWGFLRTPLLVPDSCRNESTTLFQWVSTGRTFAEETGRAGTLVNIQPAAFLGATSEFTRTLRTGVPRPEGILYAKQSGLFTTDAALAYRSVCEFEPASSYDATKVSVIASIRISAGLAFSVCAPTSVVGLCLSADLDFIFGEMSARYQFSNFEVFRTNRSLLSTQQEHRLLGEVEWGFLSGGVKAELRLLFRNIEWDIVRYSGLQSEQSDQSRFRQTLFKVDLSSKKEFP